MSEENITNNNEETVEASEQVRTPRGGDDRKVEQRKESWENPSNLPNPDPQPGWVFRYIRTSLLGEADNPNVSKNSEKVGSHVGVRTIQNYRFT